MILVNVFFQEINRSYDFRIDEKSKIEKVIEDMAEMIALKEHLTMADCPGMYLLCGKSAERIFNPDTTLAENGVSTGDTLLLV